MAGILVLANPAQIFEEAKELARLSNSNAFATVPQAEQALKLSLKDDLLSLLGGEIAVELDTETSPQPVWKAILAVNDANHLQQTLDALVVQVHFEASQVDDGGVTCHTLRIPSGKGTTELAYAFSDGYMVVGSSREAVAEAVQFNCTAPADRWRSPRSSSLHCRQAVKWRRRRRSTRTLWQWHNSACGRLSQFFLNTSLSTEVTLLRR